MTRMLKTWSRGALQAMLFAGLALGFAGNAAAVPVELEGMQTPLKGNSEKIISLRHQEHMWEAEDGTTYLVVNRGTQGNLAGLQVYSSFDHGLSWYPGPRLPGSNRDSFSDGYLADGILYLTYTTPAGVVMFTALKQRRVTATGKWVTVLSETAFSSPDMVADNPAMAVDAMGTVWLAFVATDAVTGEHSIRMLRNSQQQGWVDTGFVFGDVDSGVDVGRSARPVATATGMGMLYSVHGQIFWASRENTWDLSQAWARQLVFNSQAADTDPYASHFSVAADAQHNLHTVISDGGRVGYLRFNAANKLWNSRWLTNDIKAAYVQASLVGNDVVLASNNYSNIAIYRSVDGGNTFTAPYLLTHPDPAGGVSYPYPRVETASRTAGPMLVLQQYLDNSTQRLLLFSVPLP